MSEGCEMNFLSFIYGWQIKIILVIALVVGTYTWHKVEVNKAVNKAVTQVVADIEIQASRERFKLKERSLNTQIELQAKVDKIQKDKDNEISNLKSRVRTLTNSLSDRPNRTSQSGVPDSTGNEESTGYVAANRLYRDDAEVAVWFATRTEGLKIELLSCYKQYDEVKKTLDKFKAENTPKTD